MLSSPVTRLHDRLAREFAFVRVVALATLALLIAGCGAEPASPIARVQELFRGPARLTDTEINPSDTYFTTDVTVDLTTTITSDTAFLDPETKSFVTSWTYTDPTATFYVEGGYDYAGRTRVDVQTLTDPDNDLGPDRLSYMQNINDQELDYLASGAALDPSLASPEPMATLSSLVYANFDGLASSGGGGCGTQIQCLRAPNVERSILPSGQLRLSSQYVLPRVLRSGALPLGRTSAQASPTKVRENRRYEKEGSVWVLREQSVDVDDDLGGGKKLHTHSLTNAVAQNQVPHQ